MKILVVLSRFPWPLEKGDKLRAYYQIKDLSRNHEVHLLCLSEHPVPPADLEELNCCTSIEIVRLPFLQKVGNLFRGLFNALPFQVNYFRSPNLQRKLITMIHTRGIDVVMVQLLRLGENLPPNPQKKGGPGWFLDYMDCFSIGMQNRISEASWYSRALVKTEAKRLQAYEKRIAARFDEYAMISDRDAEGLPPQLQKDVHILPNGVGEHFFDLPKTLPDKRYDLIFFGNMGYQPNVQSARFLVEEVLPAARNKGIDPYLCIAGARPAKSVLAYASDRIEVTGFVDDLREYVLASRLAIAPVTGGQGLQNKLIESMALGLPTLTTPHAHLALGARPGKEIIVCENEEAFAEKIRYYLEHPEEAAEIGQAGRDFVEQHFRWEAKNRQLEAILEMARSE